MLQRISDSILDHIGQWGIAFASLAVAFAVCVVLLLDVRPAIQAWGRAPQQLADLQTSVELVPGQIAQQSLTQLVPLLDKHAGLVRRDLFGEVKALRVEAAHQVTGLRGDVMPLAYAALGVVNQTRGDAVRQIEGVRRDLKPTLDGSAVLLGTYAALPDELATELKPVWRGDGRRPGLASEITCTREDGSGYGECIKSRVTALMGEWTKLGAVAVKHFPGIASDAESMVGIAEEWADKNVRPRPMTFMGKVAWVAKLAVSVLIAALRGGAF